LLQLSTVSRSASVSAFWLVIVVCRARSPSSADPAARLIETGKTTLSPGTMFFASTWMPWSLSFIRTLTLALPTLTSADVVSV